MQGKEEKREGGWEVVGNAGWQRWWQEGKGGSKHV